ncbi:MAG TPA: outer membrane lipoprotein carrier protein LolA [Chthoniobacterales bacterium]|jgi:outer membrane lipoprotein carrier protein
MMQQMMRLPSIVAAFLLMNAALIQAQSLSPQDIKAVLTKIRERRASAPHVQADFREEKSIHLMNRPIISTGKVWFEPPNKFRREVRGNSPSVTVCDGGQLWIYYPNFKSAEHYQLGKRSPLDAALAAINTALNLENVENTFTINATQTDGGYELRLLPRSPSMKRIFKTFNLWLDHDLFVSRTEMSQPNGDQIVTAYSNHSRASIPENTFEFVPPPKTEISNPLGK